MKYLIVAGARPNFMKVAAILEAFAERRHLRDGAEMKLVHTGQHYDRVLSDGFFEDLSLPEPDIHLGAGSGSHAEQTARIMLAFEKVCLEEQPDWVIVVGDVNSTLACSLTAKKLGIRVAHVEAGLRSRDMSMPEEINRLCADAISDLLFTTDHLASENLLHEGVCPERIEFVGNTMIDTLLRHLDRARSLPLPEDLDSRCYGVVTLHRPSNVDSPETLGPLFRALQEIAASVPLVFPAHPRTRRNLEEFGFLCGASAIRLVEPMGYLRFIGLVSRARFVLTDSGGIQEETTVLGVPCLTMRNNTERPITCTAGTNILVGTDPKRILQSVSSVLGRPHAACVLPKWDGNAGTRIVNRLLGIESAGAA